MNVWLWAACVLVAALVPLLVVALRRPVLEGVVGLEVAGVDAALALLLMAEGTRRQVLADVALVLVVMSFIGAIAFLRFTERMR
jgi:multisubunit Na+/H+ antiporter MnhF subunit